MEVNDDQDEDEEELQQEEMNDLQFGDDKSFVVEDKSMYGDAQQIDNISQLEKRKSKI